MGFWPEDFTPDLRRLSRWPSIEGPWRQPALVELTYGEIHRLVVECIPDQRLKILEVGCGNGFLALELSRRGHDVLGIDPDGEAIGVARRTAGTDPYRRGRGGLEYREGEFPKVRDLSGGYDAVVFSRSLHHIPRPDEALTRVRRMLKPGGRVVCVEFAYDRFDRRAATWLSQVLCFLGRAGWRAAREGSTEASRDGVDALMREWLEEYPQEHGLVGFEAMRSPLEELFHRETLSWHPYLYWDVIEAMRVPSEETEASLSRLLRDMEASMIRAGDMPPLLFRFAGTAVPG